MNRTLTLSSVALCLVLGCHNNQSKSTCTVALLDISGSIYPEEVDREFAEMQALADNMHRGDELILIPIMGNARNDTPGHIVRLVAPQARATFDSDLVAFRKRANTQITGMKDWAKRNTASHTDILGTLEIAGQQSDQTQGNNTRLIVLSDFIEDDDKLNFSRDRPLASVVATRELADGLAQHRAHPLRAAVVSLERLRSRDSVALSNERLNTVDVFWKEFLKENGISVNSVIHGENPSHP